MVRNSKLDSPIFSHLLNLVIDKNPSCRRGKIIIWGPNENSRLCWGGSMHQRETRDMRQEKENQITRRSGAKQEKMNKGNESTPRSSAPPKREPIAQTKVQKQNFPLASKQGSYKIRRSLPSLPLLIIRMKICSWHTNPNLGNTKW
jgi:hypothetical protein